MTAAIALFVAASTFLAFLTATVADIVIAGAGLAFLTAAIASLVARAFLFRIFHLKLLLMIFVICPFPSMEGWHEVPG